MGGFEIEYRIRNAETGSYRWFHTRATPVRDNNGTVLEWLATSTDVEDLKALQARQEMLVAELQLRSANLISEVEKLTEITIQDSSNLDDFRRRFSEGLNSLAR
jgi:two-component system CheB/CheR fusion protein